MSDFKLFNPNEAPPPEKRVSVFDSAESILIQLSSLNRDRKDDSTPLAAFAKCPDNKTAKAIEYFIRAALLEAGAGNTTDEVRALGDVVYLDDSKIKDAKSNDSQVVVRMRPRNDAAIPFLQAVEKLRRIRTDLMDLLKESYPEVGVTHLDFADEARRDFVARAVGQLMVAKKIPGEVDSTINGEHDVPYRYSLPTRAIEKILDSERQCDAGLRF